MAGTPIQENVVKKAAGEGFSADFKPSRSARKIRIASKEDAREARKSIVKEFAGAFKILAK